MRTHALRARHRARQIQQRRSSKLRRARRANDNCCALRPTTVSRTQSRRIEQFNRGLRFRVAAASAPAGVLNLPLPILAPDVPGEFGREGVSHGVGDIAAELMRLGVLRDEHWQGDLVPSIDRALKSWLQSELGGPLLSWFTFDLFWLEDIFHDDGFGLIHSPYYDLPGQLKVAGGFVLVNSAEPCIATVGYWISEFNRIERGAGWAIYHAMIKVCDDQLRGMSPAWAFDWAVGYDDDEVDDEDGPDLRSVQSFESLLPAEVLRYHPPDTKLLRRVIRKYDARKNPYRSQNEAKLHSACVNALHLIELNERAKDIDKTHLYSEHHPFPGIAMRWQVEHELDPTGVVMDDEMEMLRNNDCSPLNAVIPWADVAGIGEALEQLKTFLQMVKRFDDLACIVHGEGAVADPTLLVEILAPQRVRI